MSLPNTNKLLVNKLLKKKKTLNLETIEEIT